MATKWSAVCSARTTRNALNSSTRCGCASPQPRSARRLKRRVPAPPCAAPFSAGSSGLPHTRGADLLIVAPHLGRDRKNVHQPSNQEYPAGEDVKDTPAHLAQVELVDSDKSKEKPKQVGDPDFF